jgi:F-type H+-transporting ATPase subunit b
MFLDFKHDPTAWVALSFAIFVVFMWFKGRGAIMGVLDKKIAVIREEVETAENLRKEAQRLLDDYERRHHDAVREAEQVVKNAEKQSVAMRKQAELDLAETVRLREKQLEERLERMKQSAMEDIRRYAADLAIEATAGIINEKLDKTARDRLVDKAIGNIGKNLQ